MTSLLRLKILLLAILIAATVAGLTVQFSKLVPVYAVCKEGATCLSTSPTPIYTQPTNLPKKIVGCIPTGLGCIPIEPSEMAGWVLNWGIGLGTLLAILFIIIGGFRVITSAGDPENLEKAKEQITAAIFGLLFILLSVLILDTIGVSIFGLDFI